MRGLSETQARKCENATGKRCSCRCAGACHGRALFPRNAPRCDWENLSPEDPHHLEPKPMPKRKDKYNRRNWTPEQAARLLHHTEMRLRDGHREWARWPGDVEVAADCIQLLRVLQSKVRLGVDKIEA